METQTFYCTNCGYKFTPKNPESLPENCPYCNKPETLEKVKSAQDYLDETSADMHEKGKRQS